MKRGIQVLETDTDRPNPKMVIAGNDANDNSKGGSDVVRNVREKHSPPSRETNHEKNCRLISTAYMSLDKRHNI